MAKQDDGLSDLSNVLEELKYMAVDMGTEIDKSVGFDLSHYFCILLLLSLSPIQNWLAYAFFSFRNLIVDALIVAVKTKHWILL